MVCTSGVNAMFTAFSETNWHETTANGEKRERTSTQQATDQENSEMQQKKPKATVCRATHILHTKNEKKSLSVTVQGKVKQEQQVFPATKNRP